RSRAVGSALEPQAFWPRRSPFLVPLSLSALYAASRGCLRRSRPESVRIVLVERCQLGRRRSHYAEELSPVLQEHSSLFELRAQYAVRRFVLQILRKPLGAPEMKPKNEDH